MSLNKLICTIPLIVATYLSASCVEPTLCATDYFYKTYEWNYGGGHWTTSTYIPKELYYECNDVSLYQRTKNGISGYGFLVTTQDEYLIGLANSLHGAASGKGYDAYNEVSFVLSFVQSLPYTSDSVSTLYDEYPRFPVETLVDDGGDCEDTAILFATLMLILDYDSIFISPPNHLAVGIWGKDLNGYYYTHDSKRYYYCETTGDNFKIGDMPSEYEGASAHLYSIVESGQYVPGQSTIPDPDQGTTPQPDPSLSLLIVVLAIIIGVYLSRRSIGKQRQDNVTSTAPPPPPPQPLVSPAMECGAFGEVS